jgi:hypothetical protein
MPKLTIPIIERSRKYGYIYWSSKEDRKIEDFLRNQETAQIVFQGANHGTKSIDYKNRRISVGWKWTRSLPTSFENYVLTWKDSKTLKVICR